jgi:hypothetical protein
MEEDLTQFGWAENGLRKIRKKIFCMASSVGGVEPLRLIDVMQLSKKAAHYIDENKINRSLRGQKGL